MVLYSHATRELTAKIAYYGPGLCGKTTNLKVLQDRLERGTAGRLASLSTAQDRTIYFDVLPVELENIKGYTVRFQLCTVPGQVFYNETRKLVLKGVDSVVFVVDSQWSMLSQDLESFANLKENLAEAGVALEDLTVVVQYNKRDLPGVLPIRALQDSLGFGEFPFVEAVASEATGVVETFKLVSKLTFVQLLKKIHEPATGGKDALAPEAAPPSGTSPSRLGGKVPGDESSWLRLFRSRPKEETAPGAPIPAGESPDDEVFPADDPTPATGEAAAAPILDELRSRLDAIEARAAEMSAAIARAVSDVSTRSEQERVQRVEETARLMDRLLAASREEAWARLAPLEEKVGLLSEEAGAARGETASLGDELRASIGELRQQHDETARLSVEERDRAARRFEAAEARTERLLAALRAAVAES